jgi:hypothetical protein
VGRWEQSAAAPLTMLFAGEPRSGLVCWGLSPPSPPSARAQHAPGWFCGSCAGLSGPQRGRPQPASRTASRRTTTHLQSRRRTACGTAPAGTRDSKALRRPEMGTAVAAGPPGHEQRLPRRYQRGQQRRGHHIAPPLSCTLASGAMYAGVPTVDFGCESKTADCRGRRKARACRLSAAGNERAPCGRLLSAHAQPAGVDAPREPTLL